MSRILTWLAALGLIAGGCGTANTVELTDANAAAAAAPGRTTDAGSARFELRYSADKPAPLQVDGEGAFDFANRLGTMAMRFSGQSINVVVSADKVYAKLPGLLAAGSKPWISFAVGDTTAAGGGFDQLLQLSDPRDTLERLGLTSKMRKVGDEKVRGVSTVHFRGIVDFSDATIGKLPDRDRAAFTEARKRFGLTEYPIDLWLDSDGRVRRLRSDVTGTADGAPVHLTTSVELFDFGKPVKVDVPPAGQVRDSASLIGTPAA